MENREAIIRKLNALRAKANNAGTPQEAITFANKYEELMAKYRLTETDLEVKSSKIEFTVKTPRKEISMIERICNMIAALTDTKAIKGPNKEVIFLGLGADIQYADWLYNLVEASLTRGLQTLPMGIEYHKLINNGVKPAVIKHNYQIGFLAAIHNALRIMVEDRKTPGNSLVVLKHGLIKAFLDENGGTKETKAKEIKLYDNAHGIANMGFVEGSKVKLRQTVDTEETLLLK